MKSAPETWQRTTVGELCSFESGTGFGPADWTASGLPIIRIQNLNGSQEFNFYSGDPDPSWTVEPGQLLFAWAGVKGVSFGPTIWRGARGVLNQHIYRIRPVDGVELEWLYLQLMHVTASIEANAHGFKSSLVHVRKADITGQVCFRPPVCEQRAIASVMATWERGIRQLSDLIAAKLQFKQWLMRQLLTGKRRFPGFRDKWQPTSFGSFLTESRIPGSNGADARKLTIRLYGKGIVPKSDTRPGSEATQFYRRKAGQFIYSKLDFLNGAFGVIQPELDEFESSLDLPAFDVAPSIDRRWLLYFVTRAGFYKNQLGLAHGGRKARRVNPGELLKLSITIPERGEQERIADALNATDRELDILRRELGALKTQRKGLMRKLLTGQVRVKP